VYFKLHKTKRQQNQSHFVLWKINWRGVNYKVCEASNTLTDCTRDLGCWG